MHFRIGDAPWINLTPFVNFLHERSLGCQIRRSDPVGAPILIDPATKDDCMNVVSISLGVCKAPQDDGTSSFTRNKTVGIV